MLKNLEIKGLIFAFYYDIVQILTSENTARRTAQGSYKI
jgi:hypothetical protein